jgi:hypothetical protein
MCLSETNVGLLEIKKPLICQAGSAEAFAGSPATGREQFYDRLEFGKGQG